MRIQLTVRVLRLLLVVPFIVLFTVTLLFACVVYAACKCRATSNFMLLRDRKQLACAISFRDVSLSIAPSPIMDEYAARHPHAHCIFLVFC